MFLRAFPTASKQYLNPDMKTPRFGPRALKHCKFCKAVFNGMEATNQWEHQSQCDTPSGIQSTQHSPDLITTKICFKALLKKVVLQLYGVHGLKQGLHESLQYHIKAPFRENGKCTVCTERCAYQALIAPCIVCTERQPNKQGPIQLV
ncbi:UNVERIFIED_CONTAM: hypothetical protein FKN15_026081 [Acipenser sinensis]